MAQERVEVLRDLLDIARVANGLQRPPDIPVPNMDPLDDPPADTVQFSSIQDSLSSHAKTTALQNRDANAIQYTKSQLSDGDTLVFVRFPNGQPVYDATGFQLKDTHRVHSEKLKAASPVFKKDLENDWQQHRCRRRNKLLSALPDGIKYVLDLTPPEEGDDALELTAELSCSLGIRRWYKSEHSGVSASHGLVGGEDETTIHPNLREDRTSDLPSPVSDVQEIPGTAGASTTVDAVNRIVAGDDSGIILNKTLEQSKRLSEHTSRQKSYYTKNFNEKDFDSLDYCPVRHRTGIERLLQIIEGKDPRLDSAPKVWTLAVLAKHFDCANAVVDYVVTWMIAEPNCKIFEILPEDCLRIGMMLQNEVATRYAFSVLVSEEALRIGTSRSDAANLPNTNYPAGKRVTKFGRACESLDEDTLNLIQHAGRNFHARVEQEVKLLLSPNMNWLHALPELSKVLKLKEYLESHAHPQDQRLVNARKIIDNLIHYTRGRLVWAFYQPLDDSERSSWNAHRGQERHDVNPVPSDGIYTALADHEKLMTRFYWSTIRLLKWEPDNYRCATNLFLDSIFPKTPEHAILEARAMSAAETHGIPKVYISDLRYSVDALNRNILMAIRDNGFCSGELPKEAFKVEVRYPRPDYLGVANRGGDLNYNSPQKKSHFWTLGPSLDTDSELPPLIDLAPTSSKPDFWNEALRARDETIKAEGSSSIAASANTGFKSDSSEDWLNGYEDQPSVASVLKTKPQPSSQWARLEKIWTDSKSTKTAPAPMPDFTSSKSVSRSTKPSPDYPAVPAVNSRFEMDYSANPKVPIDADMGPNSPFFNLYTLFIQIERKIMEVCNAMLSRGEIQHIRPPTCNICDTLLCLGEDEYKYLPLWANGLNDGTGGVFEEAIPPAERGGAMGPGPSYHTGSTQNSRASTEIDFDGRDSVFGSTVDSDMRCLGGDTSVGVEDGWSVDHIDRRRVFSESEFWRPSASEDGSVVWVGRDEDEEMMTGIPIREKEKRIAFDGGNGNKPAFVASEQEQAALLASYSSFGISSKGKERQVDPVMQDVEIVPTAKETGKKINVADDDDNFFNTPDGDEEFESESDDDGEETETEDDFEHIS